MELKSNETVRLCKNCEEISIWNFDKLLKGEGFEYLVYGYDGFGSFDLDYEECNVLFNKISDEAFQLFDNSSGLGIILLQSEIDYLETRFKTVFILISVLLSGDYLEEKLQDFINELKEWRYYVRKDKNLLDELDRLSKQHQSSKTRINAKKRELEKLVSKAKEKQEGKKGLSLIAEKLKLQRILSMQIDLKKTSLAEYAVMHKQAIEIISQTNEQPDISNR